MIEPNERLDGEKHSRYLAPQYRRSIRLHLQAPLRPSNSGEQPWIRRSVLNTVGAAMWDDPLMRDSSHICTESSERNLTELSIKMNDIVFGCERAGEEGWGVGPGHRLAEKSIHYPSAGAFLPWPRV